MYMIVYEQLNVLILRQSITLHQKWRTKNLLFMELDELFLGTLHGKRKRLQFKIDFCYFMIILFHGAMLTI